ncbi:MAG: AAA family ATPase [Gemmataceae bacterium]|nr:AAA family ATPase [Gemmataceae bacterium]
MSSSETNLAAVGVVPASQLTARPVQWLWPNRLALGKLAILDGDPGVGKSFLTLDLCARLSTGRPFPDGSPSPGPAPSLILNGEDDADDTIVPRLQALGADLDRVFVWRRDSDLFRGVTLSGDLTPLDDALAHTRARLLVLDPIVAFLGPGVVASSDASVRFALQPLVNLVEKYVCALLLVRHLNKRGGMRALYRGGGSIGFLGLCCSGWLAAHDPHEPGRGVLAQLKNKLAPPQPSLAYRVEAPPGGLPGLNWLGPVEWTADALLGARAGVQAPPGPRDQAKEFLADFLEEGPRLLTEIWPAAQRAGLTERTLRRARDGLGVRSVRMFREGRMHSWWLLPHQEPPPRGPNDPPGLEPWLRPLIEKYPVVPPLDD